MKTFLEIIGQICVLRSVLLARFIQRAEKSLISNLSAAYSVNENVDSGSNFVESIFEFFENPGEDAWWAKIKISNKKFEANHPE